MKCNECNSTETTTMTDKLGKKVKMIVHKPDCPKMKRYSNPELEWKGD